MGCRYEEQRVWVERKPRLMLYLIFRNRRMLTSQIALGERQAAVSTMAGRRPSRWSHHSPFSAENWDISWVDETMRKEEYLPIGSSGVFVRSDSGKLLSTRSSVQERDLIYLAQATVPTAIYTHLIPISQRSAVPIFIMDTCDIESCICRTMWL